MEAIAVLISEFLAALLAPVVGILVEGIIAVGMVLLQLLNSILQHFGISLLAKFKASPKEREKKKSKRLLRIKKIVKYSLLSVFVLSLFSALIIDRFYLKDSFDWIAKKIESKTQIKISVGDIQGSFFKGSFSFEDVQLSREKHELSEFNIKVTKATVDLSLLSFLGSDISINELSIKGMEGDFKRLKKKKKVKVRKSFIVSDFSVEGLSLNVVDMTTGKPFHFPVAISKLHASPLESRFLIFNLLFRSNIEGSIDGNDFNISSLKVEGGRETAWRANKLPISKVAQFASPPLSWIEEGELDIAVDDNWKLGSENEINTQWNLVLRGIKARVPPETGMVKKSLYAPIVGLLNSRSEELKLNFGFSLHKGDFEFTANPDADVVWAKFKEGMLGALESRTGVKKEKIKDLGKKGWSKFKDFVQDKKKNEP